MSAEARIEELALTLPSSFAPAGTYVNAVRTGNLLALGGLIPIGPDQRPVTGKLGDDLTIDAGRQVARLAAMREALGWLDRVVQIASVRGVVNAAADFTAHARVVDGASDLLARSSANAASTLASPSGSSLHANLALEVELLVEIEARP